MRITNLVRALVAAKATPAMILAAVESAESDDLAALERSREKTRARVEKWREKNAGNVTKPDVTVQNGSREGVTRVEDISSNLEISGNKKKNSLGASASADEPFARFWSIYPRREGPNPKKPAHAAFVRLVAKGRDPEAIIASASAFAADNPTPTRFIAQAVTWLNQERFDEAAPILRGDEFCPNDWPATRILATRFRDEKGHDPPAAINGGRAGFMLPADWVANAKTRMAAHG